MSGLNQLLNIAWTGLNAATEALETVSNNTANVNTPGYDLESVQQTEVPGVAGQPSGGTDVVSIQRAYNQFVFSQTVTASSANQAAQVAQDNAQNLTAIFPVASGGSGGLGASLTSFFSAMNGVTQDATSSGNRQSFLSAADALASNFNSVGNQLAANLASINGQLTSTVSEINTLTQQIANLNNQIQTQSSSSNGPPVALMDNLDNLVQQLGQDVGVTVLAGPNNTLNIYTTGGQALVTGNNAANLTVTSGSYGNSLSVVYQPTGQDITASLSGGAIGGILSSRAQTVAAQNSVGAIAATVAATVNTFQSFGLDLNGALGQNLFSVSGPQVIADTSNTGSGTLTASTPYFPASNFTADNYIITKSATGYQATDTVTGQTTALGNGPTLSLDGTTLTVSGTINTGDSFEFEPTATAAQTLKVTMTDPSAVAAASPYVASPGSNLGNVTASTFSPVTSASLPAGTVIVPASDFGQNLTVQFTSATTFNVLSASNTVIASGSFSASNGAEIAVAYPPPTRAGAVTVMTLSAGTPATGDSFSLTPGGVASNGNIQAMAGLSSDKLLAGQTLTSAYGTLIGEVGSAGQTASFNAQAASGVLSQVQSIQQSISGVNLDEQAADLVAFQQAYQASAQVIATAQTLFTTLLTAVQA